MRPAVYASVMRNRKPARRRPPRVPHEFTWQRLYKVLGPASLAIGCASIVGAGVYYCCWGVQSPVRSKHSRKHKKTADSSDQHDPLKASSVHAISNDRKKISSPYSSVHDGRPNSTPGTPDQRTSSRHGYGNNRHRTPSRTSLDSQRSHHHSSRHRSSSHSHCNSHSHSPHSPHPHPTAPPPPTYKDNQVAFVNTTAPLAPGETGSVDISIDIETEVPEEKRY
ncbi:hypothetical protein MAR_029457 [Mya arenaria]|uniref:Uncharacterized protein n=1 Tax=Mya arenaria TaxID=6604 RepID=A0ABY7DJ96_MYAAR|nr:hypothetical protein MAR_029457 [Mya arenaria]